MNIQDRMAAAAPNVKSWAEQEKVLLQIFKVRSLRWTEWVWVGTGPDRTGG